MDTLVLGDLLLLTAGMAVTIVFLVRHQKRIDYAINMTVNAQAAVSSLLLDRAGPMGQIEHGLRCSLTTIAGRLHLAHGAIESILLQSVRPESIELYLPDTIGIGEIPDRLNRLRPLGLSIHFVRDIGPHTKLVYALEDFPADRIVTIDDDVIYPPNAIAALIAAGERYPGAIVANWARALRFDRRGDVLGIRRGKLLTPPSLPRKIEQIRHDPKPSHIAYPYGTGGVLYPPGALAPAVSDVATFKRLCPTEDDIWFKAMAILGGTPVVTTGLGIQPSHHTVTGSQGTALRHVNHDARRNREQMRAVFAHFDLYRLIEAEEPEAWRQAGVAPLRTHGTPLVSGFHFAGRSTTVDGGTALAG